MSKWLVKEEPSHYSWADLERDGRTEWDGVHNALALRHLKSMAPGDEAIFYHSGDERSCVGIVGVVSAPRPDLADPRGSWSVEVRPLRALARPVPLSVIRADPRFEGFDLVRISRLSVLPVPEPMWRRILALGAAERRTATGPTAGSTGPAKASGSSRSAPARRRRR